MFTWPSSWTYRISAVTLWCLFLMSLVCLTWERHFGAPAPVLWVLAAVPGLTVIIQFYLAYRLIARQDEFARALTAKRVMAAGGLTIAVATGWSVAEQFAAAPHVPTWLIYPFFWSAFALATPFINDTQP